MVIYFHLIYDFTFCEETLGKCIICLPKIVLEHIEIAPSLYVHICKHCLIHIMVKHYSKSYLLKTVKICSCPQHTVNYDNTHTIHVLKLTVPSKDLFSIS